ncbi:MAG: N-formylglutamate amidohydrolase [Desulfobacterales bacterium]|nr:N-formylglutamate amidohydrolase [Desulfobacterales bacterium]
MKTDANKLNLKELIVVIPHSGIVIPAEIPMGSLSERFPEMVRNVAWYTNWLYDFRDLLENRHIVFPFCSLILEANRHPDILNDSVPLKDVRGECVYKAQMEPDDALRKTLSRRYRATFHSSISEAIESGAAFLLDGHSTVTARGIADNQIDLMNFQDSDLDETPLYYSPDVYIETYAAELRKRLPEVKITINSSEYYTVYGHVCAEHSVNAMGRTGRRVPAIIQETNESLYKNPDRTPNVAAINRLRRAFAESIHADYFMVRGAKEDGELDQPAYRQTDL